MSTLPGYGRGKRKGVCIFPHVHGELIDAAQEAMLKNVIDDVLLC